MSPGERPLPPRRDSLPPAYWDELAAALRRLAELEDEGDDSAPAK